MLKANIRNSERQAPASKAGPLRFVTATSLFDGHDASINIMRRILQDHGVEVIHLGHDRSVDEIVSAAIQEDADSIAISSYQGGHMEFFGFMIQRLMEEKENINVFGGGGGTITDKEIIHLEKLGVKKIFSVEDGRKLGLDGMIQFMIDHGRRDRENITRESPDSIIAGHITQVMTEDLEKSKAEVPILGITGTGGAGKSSLTDELLRRFLEIFPEERFAVISIDPSRKRSGGALLGDRIRMNSLRDSRIYMRSIATRKANVAIPAGLESVIGTLSKSNFKLLIVETAGIGQSDSAITDLVDYSLYVMTPEFGAPSQLEKIDMLDYADFIALNKADRMGSKDANQQVAKQVQRNRQLFGESLESMPVFGCQANRFGDQGVDNLFNAIIERLGSDFNWKAFKTLESRELPLPPSILPDRKSYLLNIAGSVRAYHKENKAQATLIKNYEALELSKEQVSHLTNELDKKINELKGKLSENAKSFLGQKSSFGSEYVSDQNAYFVRDKEIKVENYSQSLSGNKVPRISVPAYNSKADLYQWQMKENFPGFFPYTAGVFPYKRTEEETARMFAGEGGPERTNKRFHLLSEGQKAVRLSTAFDSVTLYGRDPASRPDIYGKVGNSGVSIATLFDAQKLYSGFDLSSKNTSVSMTINGPAPAILAMYLNTAIDQQVELTLRSRGELPKPKDDFSYGEDLPNGHNGLGLALLGYDTKELLAPEEFEKISNQVLASVRGTVQADILKEDQSQNTCIFSTDFALKMMGDIQQFFIHKEMKNFYSVSISGYHIAEAGANPITQLAFTLANGFTYMEHYIARGMDPDKFAPNLSFFFSNGLDPEYAVIGRVARRIWAIALRDYYKATERSQKLKYHIQTSGRSLHAQEIQFNDIRTTLQAFLAISDNCNSLHTNAFDEAITTPTEDSVRRALAIQLIINKEFGLNKSENPMQGSYYLEYLTDIVEEAVLREFERLHERGGVLSAMELMYQRFKIQEESMYYESKKHSGEVPIIGVNTFLNDKGLDGSVTEVDLIRATELEKKRQISNLEKFKKLNDAKSKAASSSLKITVLQGKNIFEELMNTVRYCSLGEVSETLFQCGGSYRRSM